MQPTSQDLSRAIPVPWKAYILGILGMYTITTASELLFHGLGVLFILTGLGWLYIDARQKRTHLDQILQALPMEDKSFQLLQKLPKAWSEMAMENQALKAHAQREDLLHLAILNNLKAGVVVFSSNRWVRMFNPAAKRLLGSSSRLAVEEELPGIFREPESLRQLDRAFQGQVSEWTLRRDPRVLSLRAVPMTDPSGKGEGVLVTLDDITRQEALETTRQKFISNASHELKTPATSIRIASENLLDGEMVLPEGVPSLQSIIRSVDRMAMLLHDITELSRIETGALALQPVDMLLGNFVQGLLEDLQPQATARGVALSPHLEGLETMNIKADPLRLQQVLENLLSNALKFSPKGGEITLTIQKENGWLAWTVADQGPGIAPTESQRIFERFYRSPSARGIPGTGLGLSIVKHLTALMEGEIGVESDLGKGAKFTLRLPITETAS
jgi:signal transduction histidine kinase